MSSAGSTAIPAATTVLPGLVTDVRRRLLAAQATRGVGSAAVAVRDGDGGEAGPLAGGAAVATALLDAGLRGDAAVLAATRAVQRELTGLGPLTDLVDDPEVTDIIVTAPAAVWCDRGCGLEPAGVRFADEGSVRRLAQRLAARAGRRLDEGAPFVDVALGGGVRLHAVLPPIADGTTQLSLRIPAKDALSLPELVGRGTLSAALAELLVDVVRGRLTFLVTGGTGSGKTTLLSTLLGLAAPEERLLLLEDIAELRPALPHVVRLQTRPPNAEGAGEVTLRDLVRQALRMRPDRLVVGEVRGAEVVELLAAFNTGHAGGSATLHANAPADVPARVEALAVMAGLPRAAAHSLLLAAVQVVVHIERLRDRRWVSQLSVLQRTADGFAHVACAVGGGAGGHLEPGPAHGALMSLLHSATAASGNAAGAA